MLALLALVVLVVHLPHGRDDVVERWANSYFFYALAAGIVIGLFRCDIDPRRRATVTMDVRKLNYRELYRQIRPFFVFLTATCTAALSNRDAARASV